VKPDIIYIKECDFLKNKPNLYHEIYNLSFWQDEYLQMFGKRIKCPRKIAFYGESGVSYKYSGNNHRADGFYPLLETIKDETENYVGHKFNFALLNYYHDHNDSMGWHSDNEKALGKNPVIASISLGASRIMQFKHKKQKIMHNIELEDASLLLMQGDTQENWLHQIPKTKKITKSRINITFRFVFS
jgi:alkylated DNA repair dioxygenase AlkB